MLSTRRAAFALLLFAAASGLDTELAAQQRPAG